MDVQRLPTAMAAVEGVNVLRTVVAVEVMQLLDRPVLREFHKAEVPLAALS